MEDSGINYYSNYIINYKLLERESRDKDKYMFISYLFFRKGEMEKVENGGFFLDSWEGIKFG